MRQAKFWSATVDVNLTAANNPFVLSQCKLYSDEDRLYIQRYADTFLALI
jgi:hypothetical protein